MSETTAGVARRATIACLIAALVLGACGDDGSTTSTTSTSPASTTVSTTVPGTTVAPTTTVPPTTVPPTTSPATTTTSNALSPDDRAFVVWPFPDAGVRFRDPVVAARSFAVELVGFTDPLMSEFRAGDSRSGEVGVRAVANGPETVVLVRRFGPDDSWWVMGSVTGNIEVREPAPQQAIDDPLQTSGRSRAFEATVNVEVVADGRTERIGTGWVMGGAGPEFGPFTGSLPFTSPRGGWGCVIYLTSSALDGRVWEATTVRVGFIGGD